MIKLKKLIEEHKIDEKKEPKKPILITEEKCDLITRLRERQQCEEC